MTMQEMRVRVPVELLDYKSLISVGVRLLLACESLPECRKEDFGKVSQTRLKLTSHDHAAVRHMAKARRCSESSIAWAALALAARSRLNPTEDPTARGRRRATDRGGVSELGSLVVPAETVQAQEPGA